MNSKYRDITRNNNVFTFHHLNHPKVVSNFIRELNVMLNNESKDIRIDFSKVKRQFFPSVLVPIAGLVDRMRNDKIEVTINHNDYTSNLGIDDPAIFDPQNDQNVLNRVLRFNEENMHQLERSIFEALEKMDVFPKGVLYLSEWTLNEVMDNVLIHSGCSEGFVMVQLHPSSKHIAFCVFDFGKGFKQSFIEGDHHHPKSEVDAITLAIQEGITSNKSKGQGNGLFGLHSLVAKGEGRLLITSGAGSYRYLGHKTDTYERLPKYRKQYGHTVVDFVVDYSKDLSVEDVLTMNGQAYKPTYLRIEEAEDERGWIPIKIKDLGEGTGSRSAALALKNKIMNILIVEPKNIILDFEGVGIASSSYVDELIAKLLIELGLFQFNNLIHLRNMNENIQTILQRSVIQRVIDNFKRN